MEARGQVLMEGEPLKHAFTFTYLGYDFRADGKAEHAIEERMRKAALRFSRSCVSQKASIASWVSGFPSTWVSPV